MSGSGHSYRARSRSASLRSRLAAPPVPRRFAALPALRGFSSTRCGSSSMSSTMAACWLRCPDRLASRYAFHSGSLAARHSGTLWNDTRSYSGLCSATCATSGGSRCTHLLSGAPAAAVLAALAVGSAAAVSVRSITRLALDLPRGLGVLRVVAPRAYVLVGVTGVCGAGDSPATCSAAASPACTRAGARSCSASAAASASSSSGWAGCRAANALSCATSSWSDGYCRSPPHSTGS